MEDLHDIAQSLSRKGRGLNDFRIGDPSASEVLKKTIDKYVTPEQHKTQKFSYFCVSNNMFSEIKSDYMSISPESTPRHTPSPIAITSNMCCDTSVYNTSFSQRNLGITPQ